ncbi:MAG: hypothetical protein JNL28_13510 [Planctomycetes bacterium]|nr:hypothetical protein [Planctomycetota bacterium]
MNAIARVSVEDIEHIKERGYLAGIERSATEENPYHGDILFPNAPAWQTRLAQSALAVNATRADE